MIRAKRENMEKDTDKDMNETSLIFTGDIGFDKYIAFLPAGGSIFTERHLPKQTIFSIFKKNHISSPS